MIVQPERFVVEAGRWEEFE